ncbi:hypothetical protein CVT24_001943 [Panaeolus cyanescens]|uniref:ATP-grasp domain-containing protein n=1 Tax=Panaeolus cyanescens TaxID=181874 RepID=A0A409YHV0_9AGAR|nr:hypothetical protein CVT24_001943 [Panaeolus cyanescens]
MDNHRLTESTPLNIAFTYDSISEWLAQGLTKEECAQFQTDETLDAIAAALAQLGTVERIGTLKSLVQRLGSGVRQPWDIVFNFSESIGGLGKEGHVPGLLEAYQYNYTFSDSSVLALCMDKAKTKMVLDYHGIPTSPFACILPRAGKDLSPQKLVDKYIWKSRHADALRKFPLFVKPAADNSGVGIQQENKVDNETQLTQAVERLTAQFPDQTILVERFLQGREFTVGILGTGAEAKAVGVMELVFLQDHPDCPIDPNAPYVSHDEHYMKIHVYGSVLKNIWTPNPQRVHLSLSDPVVVEVVRVALEAWNVLGCRDGGRVDIRCDILGEGAIPHVMEVNPIPGLTPYWSDLPLIAEANGMDFNELIASIVRNAMSRATKNAH